MSGITINSNLAAAAAQRQLGVASDAQARTFERLSSGLRINRASDDAAGLAIASSLNSSGRVYSQAIRNANDGISALAIAEGGLGQLSNILTRMRELSTQAANGSFSRFQRMSIQSESDSLTNEFNRIIESTSFNGINLLDLSNKNLSLQLGYGTNERLGFEIGGKLQRAAGNGGYSTGTASPSPLVNPFDMVSGDFNGDGKIDIVSGSSSTVYVAVGNGDGTFKDFQTFSLGTVGSRISAADINGDGSLDLAITTAGTSTIRVLLNNGNGTFGAVKIVNASNSQKGITLADFNADGKMDIVYGRSTNAIGVLLGNGNGTFGTELSLSGSGTNYGVQAGDFNGDGKLDILAGNGSGGTLSVFLGNGNGTFGAASSVVSGMGASAYNNIADFNRDGILDIATNASSGAFSLLLGNGDGTFKAATSHSVASAGGFGGLTLDLNQDGYMDVAFLGGTNGGFSFAYGNGDGTFRTGVDVDGNGNTKSNLIAGDFNGDGLPDIVGSISDLIGVWDVHLAGAQQTTALQYLNLATQEGAYRALESIEAVFTRLNLELGSLGAAQSRIDSATQTLLSTRDNYKAAEGRIIDADVASESASLIRNNILKQTASAVLGQASQQPALVLQLLGR